VFLPGGMGVFDCNSLHTYATTFASSFVRECGEARFRWQGQADPVPRPKAIVSAMIEIFSPERPGSWRRVEVSRHLQRHHPRGTIARALRRAGLALLAVRGQYPGARLVPDVDEEECPKLVYLAHKPEE
jgi:hypothetical protein